MTGRRNDGSANNYQWVENRPQKYWKWYKWALYLLFSLDIVSTLGATAIYGTGAEVNPLMVWMIEQGPVALVIIHLLALVLVVLAFDLIIQTIEITPDPYDILLEILTELWLGFLLLAGLFVLANNLTVIAFGQSLV